jgi:hypothetical protein
MVESEKLHQIGLNQGEQRYYGNYFVVEAEEKSSSHLLTHGSCTAPSEELC